MNSVLVVTGKVNLNTVAGEQERAADLCLTGELAWFMLLGLWEKQGFAWSHPLGMERDVGFS